ncbi:MAG: hypothetical protein MJ204_11015 [Bacteroidales bacterium]|nr:hypothetical protein [Bacteroidales bacterium]
MGDIQKGFERQLGKLFGNMVGNVVGNITGLDQSSHYTRHNGGKERGEAAKTRAESQASVNYARADAIEQRELNAIDAAVIKNVDTVINSELGNTPAELVKTITGLCIQLETNSFDHESKEETIRAKYTNAVLTKLKYGIRQLEYIDPNNPNLNEFIRTYYKAKRRKWRASASWKIWFWTILAIVDLFGFMFIADDLGEGEALVTILLINLALVILYLLFLVLYTLIAKLSHRIRRKKRIEVLRTQNSFPSPTHPAPVTEVYTETNVPPIKKHFQHLSSENLYRPEFIDLLKNPRWQNAYIGQGNPNAKILIIGREHGFDSIEQRHLEIEENYNQWIRIISGEDFSELGYSPRHCYAQRRQEFRIAPTTGGTSATWFVYQKMVNAIIPHRMVLNKLDFFKYSFITEFSAINRGNNSHNNETDIVATATSIAERTPLLSSSFYRSFPIVILSCGDYFDHYKINIEEMFNVKWEGYTREVVLGNGKKAWLNMHYSYDRKRIVIHTWQASAFTHGSEETYQPFFDEIGKLTKNV